mmetsp:Transcript_14333/g.16648  ORF Transcript_14333/g.16648 Transcript_14333/m.16648 type:complete len:133 (+) Transcript_14333:235-633(+)
MASADKGSDVAEVGVRKGVSTVSYEEASGKTGKGIKVDRVANIYGSTAGASSSSFHIYRNHRRTEMFRLQKMDREHETELLNEALNQKRQRNEEESARKTDKKAEKRRRKKLKKKQLMMEAKRKLKREGERN